MATPMNELDTIRNYFSRQAMLLDGPASFCCDDIQFDYFTYTSDGDAKAILYSAYKPDIPTIQKAIKELPVPLECVVVKTSEQDYCERLLAMGGSLITLSKIKKELESYEVAEKQQTETRAGVTDNILKEALPRLDALRKAIEETSKDFIRTTSLCEYGMNGTTVTFDLRDILLVGAVAQADILLTGKTGSGKTKLANAVMRGLFGDKGYYSKTILPTMTPAEFMDIDFDEIKKGGELSDAIKGIPALENAGIVLNEVNRAPGVIQNMLIAFLDKEFEVQGKPVPMGKKYNGDKRYQLRILTINEGGMYRVENLDPAIRDRMTIEVPVDAFPQSREDVLQMLDSEDCHASEERLCPKCHQPYQIDNAADQFETVIQLHTLLGQVPVTDECKRFLAYLAGMSYCIVAPRGNKESITLTAETCNGCDHEELFGHVCPSVRAPSARILLQLQKIARAFALFRSWKGGGVAQVGYQDIVEAAPFVLYSKLSLTDEWVRTAPGTHGDRWTAIKILVAWVYKDCFLPTQDVANPMHAFLTAKQEGNALTREMLNVAQEYITKKDPWSYNYPALMREIAQLHSVKPQ